MVANGWMPSLVVSSTGRRIEWLSISLSTMKPSPAPMPPTMPAAAIRAAVGLDRRVRLVRLLDQGEALALGEHLDLLADLGLAEGGDGVVVLGLQVARARAGARRAPSRSAGVAWLGGVEVVEGLLDASPARRRCTSAARRSGRARRRARRAAAPPGRRGPAPRATPALVVDEALQRGDAGSAARGFAGSRGCRSPLLQELALQVLQLLLLGAERLVHRAPGALVNPDHGGALVLECRFLALEVEQPLLLALLLVAPVVQAVGQRGDVGGLEVG